MFDSKRLSLNLNPWSVWTFQEDDILQLSLMQGNFGFIQTMRAMDQKSTGWSWYSQWSCVLHIGYALYALFISCPSNFSVFIWLGVSDAPGTGEAGAWVWDTPAVDNGPVNWWVFLAVYEMVRSLGARPKNQTNQYVPSGNLTWLLKMAHL